MKLKKKKKAEGVNYSHCMGEEPSLWLVSLGKQQTGWTSSSASSVFQPPSVISLY